jgi:membrane-bound lytic murein transglycosylase D
MVKLPARTRVPFLLLLPLLGLGGCRSSSPSLEPGDPAAASPAPAAASPAPAAPAPVPVTPPVAVPTPMPPQEEAASGEETPEEEPATEPEQIQREALEACQSAEELIASGEIEGAIAAVDHAYALMLELPGDGDDTYLQAKEDIRVLAGDLIGRLYAARRRTSTSVSRSWDLAMRIVNNEHVQRELRSFTTVERDQFLEGYRRSGLYRPMILERLAAAGLPAQLSWMPLVESWFKVRALSRASALGMWQFIASTGVRFGLDRDTWVDDRLDPEKSTDAAIAYLVELHDFFGDWPKVLAAYNCGEARVMRLSRQSSEYQDFWDLYAMLPGETRRYVPRLFAALQIIEDPAKYGMTLPEPETAATSVAVARVERSVKLESLDKVLGLEPGTLAALNPALRRQATPRRAYDLRVPAGREDALLAQIASVPVWTPPVPKYTVHRVRRGDTLSQIAGRYHTSVRAIMRANNLRSANRLRVGQRLRIPTRGGEVAAGGS